LDATPAITTRPAGRRRTPTSAGNGFSGGGTYFFGDSRIRCRVIRYNAKYGIPSDTTFIDMHQTKALLRSSFALNRGRLQTITVDGGYADYKHNEVDPATRDILSTFLNKEWDVRGEGLFGAMGPLSQSRGPASTAASHLLCLGDASDYLKSQHQSEPGRVPVHRDFRYLRTCGSRSRRRAEHARVTGTPASNLATVRSFTPVSGSGSVLYTVGKGVNVGFTVASAAPGAQF